jgi:hypothetical protein
MERNMKGFLKLPEPQGLPEDEFNRLSEPYTIAEKIAKYVSIEEIIMLMILIILFAVFFHFMKKYKKMIKKNIEIYKNPNYVISKIKILMRISSETKKIRDMLRCDYLNDKEIEKEQKILKMLKDFKVLIKNNKFTSEKLIMINELPKKHFLEFMITQVMKDLE